MNKLLISSFVWKFLERIGVQGVQFIVQIILARLLLPSDFGSIALITIFISISNVFVQSGFNTALIQKKHVDEVDYSSVFIISIFVALILYVALYLLAPFIAEFYKLSILKDVVRVLSLTLFFGAFNSIQVSIISREFAFKKLFICSVGAYIISGTIGVIIAFKGGGIWAIVAQQLVSQIGISVIMIFIVKWRPRACFDFGRIKMLFSFGSKMLLSNLIDTTYNNIYGLVIGKCYSPTSLGYYNRADQFPQILIVNINSSIQSVILPALSKEQDNREKIKNLMRRAMLTSSYIVFPLMAGLAIFAEPIVKIVLTDKWLPCVPIMQYLCVAYAMWPIHTANLQAISALGRSDIFLKLEIIKKIIGLFFLWISIPLGLMAMVMTKIISSAFGLVINAYPNKNLLNYSYTQQIKDLLPNLIITLTTSLVIISLSLILDTSISSLFIEVIVGIAIYLFLSIIFKLESYLFLLNILMNIFK